jgi:hypothetical protein
MQENEVVGYWRNGKVVVCNGIYNFNTPLKELMKVCDEAPDKTIRLGSGDIEKLIRSGWLLPVQNITHLPIHSSIKDVFHD